MPLASPIFCRFFETIHDPLSEIPCPLGPNVNRWAALGASREPTFPFNNSGQTGHAIGFAYFLLLFEIIHDHPSLLPYPLGPNVNRWDVLGASREPTFPFNNSGQTGHAIGFAYFLLLFEIIHDHPSLLPYPLGPNVNRWAVLGASREPTFFLNVTCVGQVGRLGMPLASPIFYRFFENIQDPLNEIPCPLGPNVNSWAVLVASREPTFPFNVTCVGTMGRLFMPLDSPIFC